MVEAGFTRGEIRVAAEEAKRTAKQRQRTARRASKGLGPLEDVFYATRWRLGRLGKLRKENRAEGEQGARAARGCVLRDPVAARPPGKAAEGEPGKDLTPSRCAARTGHLPHSAA